MSGLRWVVAASVTGTVSACLAVWSLDPSDVRQLVAAVFVCGYWALVEGIARSRERWALHGAPESRRLLELTVAFVAVVMLFGQCSKLALRAGLIRFDDVGLLLRVRGSLIGLWMAYFGDRLAKLPSPWRIRDEPFDWQRVHAFTGRLWTAVGSLIVLLWTTTSVSTARGLMPWLVLLALVLAPARKLTSVARYASGHRPVVS